MVNYPSSLDALANPTATTKRNASGFEHYLQHANVNDIVEALEAKLGIGATTPDTLHKTPKATAAGTTAWGYYSLVKIAEVAGTGSSGVLTFSSIPATFRALMLLVYGRSTASATSAVCQLTANGNTTAGDYDSMTIYNSSASAVAAFEALGSVGYLSCGSVAAANSTANLHTMIETLIPEYANTAGWKSGRTLNNGALHLASGSLIPQFIGQIFESTAAISSLALTLSAGNWTTTSRATLLGLPAD